MSHTFKVGDRVRYVGRDKKPKDRPSIKGEVGTVREVVDDANRRGLRVAFDNNDTLQRPEAAVFVSSSFIPYDPDAPWPPASAEPDPKPTRDGYIPLEKHNECVLFLAEKSVEYATQQVAAAELMLDAARDALAQSTKHVARIKARIDGTAL